MLNYSSHSGKASAAMAAEAFLRKHQMDMFGGEPEMVVTLPAAQVNHVGVLVSNLLVRGFVAGRDSVEIKLGQHNGKFYKSVSITTGCEYSGYAPSIRERGAASLEECWEQAISEARVRLLRTATNINHPSDMERAKRAQTLLSVMDAGDFMESMGDPS